MNQTDIAGENYLEGVREMASGFLLKFDFTFQFFFSYGALDRYGNGQWAINNWQLVLDSGKDPSNDFEMLESSKKSKNGLTIKIQEPNPVLRKHVYASMDDGKPGSWIPADNNGEINFPKQDNGSVSLLLEFCPERITRIPIKAGEHNHFSFRMLSGIMEVNFSDFRLDIEEAQLKGRHPLLEGNNFIFKKSG